MPTNPILSKLLDNIGPISDTLNSLTAGRAQGRAAETNVALDRDRNATSNYGIQQGAEFNAGNLDLARKGFTESARGSRARQAFLGDILSNFQPTQVNVPGIKNASIVGGLAASMGPLSKAAGAEMSRQAMLKLMEGDEFTGGEVLNAPRATPLPKASGLDKFLSGAGMVGSLAGSIAPLFTGGGRAADVPSLPYAGAPTSLPGTQVDGVTADSLQSILDKLRQYAEADGSNGGGGF